VGHNPTAQWRGDEHALDKRIAAAEKSLVGLRLEIEAIEKALAICRG
jgi:hypothetical protein